MYRSVKQGRHYELPAGSCMFFLRVLFYINFFKTSKKKKNLFDYFYLSQFFFTYEYSIENHITRVPSSILSFVYLRERRLSRIYVSIVLSP